MAENVGWSTLDVIPSVRGLATELEKQTRGDLAAAGRKGGRQYGDAIADEASGRIRRGLGDALKDVARPLTVAAAGAGIVAGFRSVVSSASEAEQAVGGVHAVFKQYADGVIADSQAADQALGLSASAYQQLVTLSGALLKNKGISDFAAQARTLVETGADLAAQFGGSTKDAVDALNAALRGESDPIERYAISLNETAVNAELAAKGQAGLTGAALDQAKTQARLTIIQRQAADAQGAFARESETLAGKQARLSAEWANMRAELGSKLLPITADFVGLLNDKALPALQDAGGVVSGLASGFRSLPPEVQAATVAMVAYRAAQAAGVTDSVASGLSRTASAFDDIRLRGMVAADAWRDYRSASIVAVEQGYRFSDSSNRVVAGLAAIRAGAQGASGALRRGLSGALGMVGGPWGAAFVGATLVVGKFWREQQKAKEQAKELTATLGEQTGAITEQTEATVFKNLQSDGAIRAAQMLGVGLTDVRQAALGSETAMTRVNAAIDAYISALPEVTEGNSQAAQAMQNSLDAADKLRGALGFQTGVVEESSQAWRDQQEFLKGSTAATEDATDATEDATKATGDYRGAIERTRDAIRDLMQAENDRREAAAGDRRDRIGLLDQLAAARKEAREGKKTLDENTAAGRENWNALLDLADQWNQSTPKVRNAKGAYKDIREEFVEVAEQMGANEERAKMLADELLKVPKKAPVEFQTKGYREAMERIRRLREESKYLTPVIDLAPRGFGNERGGPSQPRPTSPRQPDPQGRPAPMFTGPITVVAQDMRGVEDGMKRLGRRAAAGGW